MKNERERDTMDSSRGMNTAPKGAGQAANATSRKYKNERHHTYAMFLYRDVRQVSLLTGESNVTKEVHESGMTSCTVRRKGDWAQKPHFSEAANTK